MVEAGSRTGLPSLSRVVWVNRHASLISRVRALPSSALPRRPSASPGHYRDAGPVDGDVQHVGQGLGRREGDHAAGADRVGLPADRLGGRDAGGLGGPLGALDGQLDAGQFGQQASGRGERHSRCRPGGHLLQPGRQRSLLDAKLAVPGGHAVPAGRAVVPGAAQPHRAHHRVDGLGPAGDEPGLVAVPAACARAAMPGIHSQQVFQQAAAQLQHRGADHQLHRLQALAGCQRAGRLDGQGRYLGGDLRRERLAEPPLSPAGPAGEPPAADVTGLASQIASLTSTICSQSAVNSL